LFLEALSELGGWCIGEAINSGGDGALIGQISGDSTLVLLLGTSNEGGVEDQTILWGLTFGLQGSEQSLLSSKKLNGGGWILAQVGEATSVGDQLGADGISNKGGKIWCNSVHSLLEVLSERLSEVNELCASV